MTEATDSLVIQRVESALNAKHGITGYLVVSRHRGVVASSFAPGVDIGPITNLCQSVLAQSMHKMEPNCHVQTTLVMSGTGVFHLQHMTNYALVVLTPPAAPVDLEVLVRIMEEHLEALERQ